MPSLAIYRKVILVGKSDFLRNASESPYQEEVCQPLRGAGSGARAETAPRRPLQPEFFPGAALCSLSSSGHPRAGGIFYFTGETNFGRRQYEVELSLFRKGFAIDLSAGAYPGNG